MRKVILISFLCALFSCENDDMNTTQQILNDPGIRLNYVSNEFYNNNEAINNELKRFKLFKQNYIRNSIGNTDDQNLIMKSTDIPEYGITIEEDNVAHIQAGEYESFTFQIYNHYVTDELHNLCLSKRNDGSYNAYIYKYDLSQNQINQLDNGIMPSDLGSDASIISIEYLETTNMPLNIKSTFDPCEEYPCTVTHGGIIYWMFGANKCHSFESRLINGSWVITYPEVACPPEYTDGSDQNGGSSGGNTSGGTTQGGTQSAGGSTQGSGGTTQGGTQGGGTNTNPNGDNGWAGGGNGGSGSNNNNSTNSNDDENETYYCRQTEDGGEGECLSDITTPVACVEEECEDEEDCNTSKDDLKDVFPNTSDSRLQEISDAINEHAADFDIDTKEELQHFLSQAGHESSKFNTFEENLNYRIHKLGIDYWKKRFNPYTSYTNPPTTTIDSTKRNPNDFASSTSSIYVDNEKFANYVYCCRMNNGDEDSGDGYKFRGRGIFQLTGKSNYTEFNQYYQENYDENIDLSLNPDLVATDMEIVVISALWYYKEKVLNDIDIDENTNVEDVTEKINGGTNGLNDREEVFNLCELYIECN